MWTAARPIVTWRFPVRILSTHNGVGSLFNRFIEQIKKGKLNWSLHTVSIFDAVDQGLVDKILRHETTVQERQEWLDNERASCADETTWQQEYCCNPMDESSAFLPYDLIASCEREVLLDDLSEVQGDLYLGFDVARKGDLSIIRVLEKLGLTCYARKRIVMRNETFAAQKERLWKILVTSKCCAALK